MSLEAHIALNRFGLGARPGQRSEVASDPRGWLSEQVREARPVVPPEIATLPSSAVVMREARARRDAAEGDREGQKQAMADIAKQYRSEAALRELAAARSTQPFRERLVRFWSNHFAISTTSVAVRALAGAFEREAIRPNLDGRFGDLVLAAEQHPAMQLYLDNARSIGPDSMAGERSGRGLNENHAREILELHTLGVDGGYTQDDVEALAAILTGWGVARGRGEIPGGFVFDERRHQPGSKKLMGSVYRERGVDEGKAALRTLARHPATARFVCTKLVRHFVSDHPPASAVERLTKVFLDSGGHLPVIHQALIDLPEAWERRLSKLKSPADLVTSTARGLGFEGDGRPMVQSLRYLGQIPFQPPSPQGWPDRAKDWLGPEAVLTRVEWAEKVGGEASSMHDDPEAVADALLGPLLTERTRQAVREGGPGRGLALLIASPEFQRR